MLIVSAITGALLITYGCSRLMLALLARVMQGRPMILLAHLLAFVTVALIVGPVKSHITLFREQAVPIYIVPQLFWLALDLLRTSLVRQE